ncbi:MAG TPA: glycoside hydrolase family 97 protein [Lacipirellulaceae bacterium]|nr:glycoside hydrolase family 97 protein [Lacipirellulaceae bacterium]
MVLSMPLTGRAEVLQTAIQSPDGRNSIVLDAAGGNDSRIRFTISRDGHPIVGPSPLGPVLAAGGPLGTGARITDVQKSKIDESFQLPWGKTSTVVDRCSKAEVTLTTPSNLRWQVELRAYDDGVAFRYRLPQQEGLQDVEIRDEVTQFDAMGEPTALFDTLKSFTTSHESLYERKPLSAIPVKKLMDMPLLLVWPNGQSAAITEARVRHFAGMYLERPSEDSTALRCRLSPLPSQKNMCVVGKTPLESPWRVVLLADAAGKLLESNLLLCLNDPPQGDFSWAHPGKTSFHWWYGEFEDDYKAPSEPEVYFDRHRKYIDFCAKNNIAYHAVSGDGFSWYKQSKTGYGRSMPDADVRIPRPELELPKIIAYARERGVDIRLWVHWKALSEHLEEAFTLYESWGVKGLMVDFLDRDDQEMIDFEERMLESAARHKLNIQIHGSSKYSGEQRTFPNLFNREGVLGLEYLKWSNLCTPQHSVNVAYTRALAGPVDFHLGGFRSVSRATFQPQGRAPVVMGTRCHNLALYVVYENPMPMVADAPSSYERQTGFEFITEVPTTWDETRFVVGEPGEYIVVARRKGNAWYLGGITNWTPREIDVPLAFLAPGEFDATLYVDGSMDESQPNAITKQRQQVSAKTPLHISMAPGGGFTAVLNAE